MLPTELTRRTALKLLGSTGLVAGSTGLAAAHGNQNGQDNAEVNRQKLSELKQATKKYHNVSVAEEDGYTPTEACVPNMGYHYVNFGLASTPEVDHTRPEVLLYEPQGPDGEGRKLVGVEFLKFVPGATEQSPPPQPPQVLGVEMDGPMEGHEEGQPDHFDLHVWIWESNPHGLLTPSNPNVKC